MLVCLSVCQCILVGHLSAPLTHHSDQERGKKILLKELLQKDILLLDLIFYTSFEHFQNLMKL